MRNRKKFAKNDIEQKLVFLSVTSFFHHFSNLCDFYLKACFRTISYFSVFQYKIEFENSLCEKKSKDIILNLIFVKK